MKINMEKRSLRETFGDAIVEIGETNDKLVLVNADLEDSTKAVRFRQRFPERSFTVGIAEQDLIGTAVGLSKSGLIPVANSFAVFLTNRPYDQIRMSVCYNNCNVKMIATHGGVTVGQDGGSAQSLEDLAIMRVLPNMRVICPSDSAETYKATKAMIESYGPVYMRLPRGSGYVITDDETPFEIGKANIMLEGNDLTIVACGLIVSEALCAAEELKSIGISAEVINCHTIKPLDHDTVCRSLEKTGALVTAEEHQLAGGLGSAVLESISRKITVPAEMVGVDDHFGQSGTPDELLAEYKLTSPFIVSAAENVVRRKADLR